MFSALQTVTAKRTRIPAKKIGLAFENNSYQARIGQLSWVFSIDNTCHEAI